MADICEGISWVTDDPLGIGDLISVFSNKPFIFLF
jgi:hypothetical protein